MRSFFISSTFKDMQAERDVLHERIFPRLRRLIREYGEDIQEVDLRWGVDTVNMTEEESGHEVLRICIDAIDRCKPYFIVLLGERYGWVPGREIVDSADDTRISDRYDDEMSMTELEIQYGALLNDEDFKNCVFCFRDSSVVDKIDSCEKYKYTAESDQHAKRLKALKNQIRARKEAVILDYPADWDSNSCSICGLECFEEQLYSLLEKIILRDLADKEVRTLKQRQDDEIKQIKQEYLSSYVRRYPEEFNLMRIIGKFIWNRKVSAPEKDADCVLVRGVAGSGKSALMAFVAEETNKQTNTAAILCFAAASGCTSPQMIKSYIAFKLEEILGLEHNEAPGSMDEHLRALDKKIKSKAVVCFVDGLDQIYAGEKVRYIDFPALCPNVFWVFSALSDFPFEAAFSAYKYKLVNVEGLYPEQRESIIANTAAKRGKKLDAEVVGMISSRSGADNPLFISLVLQRFFMMNKSEFEAAENMAPGMEGLHLYMQKILTEIPSDPGEMAGYILKTTAALFCQQQFSEILMFIAMSVNGLTENEISDILMLEGEQFSQLTFQQTVSYLYDAFSQRAGGKWTFNHRLFKEAVMQSMTEDDKNRIKTLLVRYSGQNEDFMKKEGFLYLLESRCDSVAQVLEKATSWDSREKVYNEVGTLSRDDKRYRKFFIEIASKYPSDEMAEFWLQFEDFVYGEDVEKMASEIIRILLGAKLSDKYMWQLAVRSIYMSKPDALLEILDRAKQYAGSLPEPELSIANAVIYAETARVLSWLKKTREEVSPAEKKTVEFIDRAVALLGDCGELDVYCKLFEAMKQICRNATVWEAPEAMDLWFHALELMENTGRFTEEEDYDYYKIVFLYSVCKVYCSKYFRDYDKAKLYGEKAMELAEKLVEKSPTVRNLETRKNAIYAYVKILKEEYQYPYLERAVDCAKRTYATQKTDYYKKELAYAVAWYAVSAGKAINVRGEEYKNAFIDEVDGLWEHSAMLFEELLKSGHPKTDLAAYATYLADYAEIYYTRGYMEKAMSCVLRSIELLKEQSENYVISDSNEDVNKFEASKYGWYIAWLARTHGAAAKIHLARLETEACEEHADEAVKLSLERAKTMPYHFKRAIECSAMAAKAKYYQRKDREALAACDFTEKLISDSRAEKYDTEEFKAEINYIRARLALEKGDVQKALQIYSLCEESSFNKYLFHDKLLILKADCLEAKGAEEAQNAWIEALNAWRKRLASEKARFETDERFSLSKLKDNRIARFAYRRESREYALAAYYMTYCYYRCVKTEELHNELSNAGDATIFEILALTEKGILNDIRPSFIKVGKIFSETKAQERITKKFSDFNGFMSVLEGCFADKKNINTAAYGFILDNSGFLDKVKPTAEQYDRTRDVIYEMIDHLRNERFVFKDAVRETEFLRKAFPLKKEIPVFSRYLGRFDVWDEERIRKRPVIWHGFLRFVLFALRYKEMDVKDKSDLRYHAKIAFRMLTDMNGGTPNVIKEGIKALSDSELDALIDMTDLEYEFGCLPGTLVWFEQKNFYVTEMYRRTGNEKYISNRLAEFCLLLTEEFKEMYEKFDISRKTSSTCEAARAAQALLRLMSENVSSEWGMIIAKWIENIPELSAHMSSQTLDILTAESEVDIKWLADVKMSHYKKWLYAMTGKFSSLSFV